MLFSLAINDFKAKYAGSALGAIWAFINPIITILIYWFVFQLAFQNGPVEGAHGSVPYVIWLISGIIPWFFISEGWGGATGVLVDYSYLVKKVVFKIEMLPTVRILSAFFVHLFFVLLMFIVTFSYGFKPMLIHFQIFYYMAAAFILSLTLGQITSVLTAFAKDVGNIVGVLVQFGFWITPIFWNINSIPENLHVFFKYSPIYYVTEGYRDTIVYNIPFWEKPYLTVLFWLVVLVLWFVGRFLYNKLRPHLADLL